MFYAFERSQNSDAGLLAHFGSSFGYIENLGMCLFRRFDPKYNDLDPGVAFI